MNITLYSTKCPKCSVLEKKLKMSNIDFDINYDVNLMRQKGFMSAPVLEVDGETYNFKEAVDWIKTLGVTNNEN